MQVRGLAAALNGVGKYKYKSPDFAVDYLVVGGGVVGLAVARQLALRFPSKSTYLVERHSSAGQETSSRNSEVIHAGLYYPANSSKTQLCLRGRHLMYEHCRTHNVPFQKTGKLVVARSDQQAYIDGLYAKAVKLGWPPHSELPGDNYPSLPTKLISGEEARQLEPDLSKDITAALWSPETGIVDSHTFMESLETDVSSSEGAELVYGTSVVRVDPYSHPHPSPTASNGVEAGWVVQTVTGDSGEGDAMLARTLINCSGLSGHLILNSLLPEELRIPMFYGRGSYASYKGPGVSHVSHLIYPCPDQTNHAFQSLGSHLTLDLQKKIRFGPDLDWLHPIPLDGSSQTRDGHITAADPDFWHKELIPDNTRLSQMHKAVQEYLPGVVFEGLQPDYCGVRPKLVGPGGAFQDFTFRTDYAHAFLGHVSQEKNGAMISLLGIESPGLTSSLAVAELVVDDLLCTKEGHISG